MEGARRWAGFKRENEAVGETEERERERSRRSVKNADFVQQISAYLATRYVAEFRVNPIPGVISCVLSLSFALSSLST